MKKLKILTLRTFSSLLMEPMIPVRVGHQAICERFLDLVSMTIN